jgi:hypothetical protein
MDMLEEDAKPEGRIKLGSLLAAIGREAGLTNEDVEAIQGHRDPTPAAPMTLNDRAGYEPRLGAVEAKA